MYTIVYVYWKTNKEWQVTTIFSWIKTSISVLQIEKET